MTHPNNPYLLKAQVAAKAMEEKLEAEKEAKFAQFERPALEPYTASEWAAIKGADETFPDADDTLEYIQQWEIECKQKTKENQMSVINKQVKQVVKDFPTYLGDCLIVNNCTESVFNILRIECVVAGQVRYLDLIVYQDTNQFLGLGGTADSTIDFRVSVNMCKTLSLVAYMKEAY